jgi:chemotaxis protein MotB
MILAGKPAKGDGTGSPVTIIIRRDEGDEPAHHGGAWKVAYADFVTAMMAFFMLLWLLNATTEVQRTGLADYFAPTNLFGRSSSGSGKPFGGQTPNDAGTSTSTDGVPKAITGHESPQQDVDEADTDVAAKTDAQSDATAADADDTAAGSSNGTLGGVAAEAGKGKQVLIQGGDYAAAQSAPAPPGIAKAEALRQAAAIRSDAQREQNSLEQAGAQLMDAIRQDPAVKDAAGQILVELVPEGLRIQVVDAEQQAMFGLGGATPTPRIRALMQKIVPALAGLPNAISIAGHTDSLTYHGQERGNWELSTERANAARRILVEAGLADERIRSVTGNADRDPLVPADPQSPTNRRITIIVLRHAGVSKPAAMVKE